MKPTLPPSALHTDVLDERHPRYAGLATNAVVQLRSYLLAHCARFGLDRSAVPHAIAALQTGEHAPLIAAGARALRGSREPAPWMLPIVERALAKAWRIDGAFSLDSPKPLWPPTHPTTAVRELTAAREWLLRSMPVPAGDDCCTPPPSLGRSRGSRLPLPLDDVLFEDQDERRLSGRELLTGKPIVLAFFYTRCTNPAKCSLTVTQLGHLQKALARDGVDARVLGVTYDPAYDTPDRLAPYAMSRGFVPDEDCRVLRAIDGMEQLSDALALGVNYGQVTVNHHRIELFVLDARGRVTVAFTRLQWNVDVVVAAVREASRTTLADRLRRAMPAAATPAAVVAAFVPHCPFCWSAYATAAGVPGLAVASPQWLHAGAWTLLGVNAIAAAVALRRSTATAAGGTLMLVATSLLAVVATVPAMGSLRGPACALLAVGVVAGLYRTRASRRGRATQSNEG